MGYDRPRRVCDLDDTGSLAERPLTDDAMPRGEGALGAPLGEPDEHGKRAGRAAWPRSRTRSRRQRGHHVAPAFSSLGSSSRRRPARQPVACVPWLRRTPRRRTGARSLEPGLLSGGGASSGLAAQPFSSASPSFSFCFPAEGLRRRPCPRFLVPLRVDARSRICRRPRERCLPALRSP